MEPDTRIDLSTVDMASLQKALTPRLTKYVPWDPTPKQRAFLLMNTVKEILYGGAAGGGKALPLHTEVATVNGFKTIHELCVGDKVFDESGSICTVTAKSSVQFNHDIYEIVFDDGVCIKADADHLWTLNQYLNRPCNKTVKTKWIAETFSTKRAKHAIAVAKPLKCEEVELPIDPYLLGLWLGDGAERTSSISCEDTEVYKDFEYRLTTNGYTIDDLYPKLRLNNLLCNKHIPVEYFRSSFEQRLALMQGLMDTDGNASSDRGYCSLCFVNERLIKDANQLVNSLGIKSVYSSSTATCTQTGAKTPKYVLKFSTSLPMFKLERKLKLQKREGLRSTQSLRYIKNIRKVETEPVQCIKVDSPSNLFLITKYLVPTHNSVVQLMAALQFVDIPNYNALLIRKTYADLIQPDALMDMAKKWLMPFVETNEVQWSDKEKKFTFPSTAVLKFGYLESDNDKYQYQGAQYQYIGVDECTQIIPSGYRYLFSRLRKPKWLNVPLRFRATANPGGEYGDYYYERFFGEEKGKRIFMGAKLDDNPFLDKEEYIESLNELDPITREQLLNGNWQIKATGDMFNREWFTIVPGNNVPSTAKRIRFWDMASTDPAKRKNKKEKREPDWTVGFLLAYYQGMYWIVDIVRVQKTPADTEELVKATARMDGHNTAIRMEQEPGSSGDMIIDHYKRKVVPHYNFDGVRSTGSKVQRAEPAAAAAQTGRILIADSCRNKAAFFDEADTFPYSVKDDTIDGLSGAFNFFRQKTILVGPTKLTKATGSYWRRAR